MLNENELWILSFYRVSEIGGALFFGRLARALGPSPVQVDLSKHFADEAQHAWLWTDCIARLGAAPLRLDETYQGRYAAALGVPSNLMEVLAVTQVFERRVVQQYARHARVPGLDPVVRATLDAILRDERWHVRWVGQALQGMAAEHGENAVAAAVRRCVEADREIHRRINAEHAERVEALFGRANAGRGGSPYDGLGASGKAMSERSGT